MEESKYRILLVDDEKSIRDTFKMAFEDLGYVIMTAKDGLEALNCIKNEVVDILITDLRMPRIDGMELLEKTLEIDNSIQVIFISAYEDIKSAVRAVKKGAFDYIGKSFSIEELVITVEKAIERKKLIEENKKLKNQLEKNYGYHGVIGKSEKLQLIFSTIDRLANSKATVLLTGESGVGKEVFARLLFRRSNRKDKNFVVINCGAIPENLIESELFGHEKGAFTGASQRKTGKFEQADGGTIFLDEVGELPFYLQVKFLRVIQERQFQRVGSLENIDIDVRIIAATNKNLQEEVHMGNFREDLYYRLNVVNLHIPPLRERKEDIPLLAQHFLECFSKEYAKGLKLIDIDTINLLMQQEWKGNIRELQNVIERAVAIADEGDEVLSNKHLPVEFAGLSPKENFTKEFVTLKEMEKVLIQNTLMQVNGNKSKAAEVLGIKRQTLYNKMQEYGM